MLTLKDFLEITDYQYTDTSKYGWKCFGDAAQYMDYWNRAQDGFQLSMLHDLLTPTVYSFEVSDFKKNKAWRWTNPAYKQAYLDECQARGVEVNQAWDDIDYKTVDEVAILKQARKVWRKYAKSEPTPVDIPEVDDEIASADDNKNFEPWSWQFRSNVPESEKKTSEVELDLSDKEILQLALEAHKRDITINKLVELILIDVIERYKDE